MAAETQERRTPTQSTQGLVPLCARRLLYDHARCCSDILVRRISAQSVSDLQPEPGGGLYLFFYLSGCEAVEAGFSAHPLLWLIVAPKYLHVLRLWRYYEKSNRQSLRL